MTALLNKAFSEASRLKNKEQNILAEWILELLHSEQVWNNLFVQSQDVLSELAEEARLEYRQGKTQLLKPETL